MGRPDTDHRRIGPEGSRDIYSALADIAASFSRTVRPWQRLRLRPIPRRAGNAGTELLKSAPEGMLKKWPVLRRVNRIGK